MIDEPHYEQQVQCVMQDSGARYDIASELPACGAWQVLYSSE